jgi:hypothetical protein
MLISTFARCWLGTGLLLFCLATSTAGAAAQSVPDQALQQAARSDDAELAGFALERGAALEAGDQLRAKPDEYLFLNGDTVILSFLINLFLWKCGTRMPLSVPTAIPASKSDGKCFPAFNLK